MKIEIKVETKDDKIENECDEEDDEIITFDDYCEWKDDLDSDQDDSSSMIEMNDLDDKMIATNDKIKEFEKNINNLKMEKDKFSKRKQNIAKELEISNWFTYLDAYTENDIWYLIEDKRDHNGHDGLDDGFEIIDAKYGYAISGRPGFVSNDKYDDLDPAEMDDLEFIVQDIIGLKVNSNIVKFGKISYYLWKSPYEKDDKFNENVNIQNLYKDGDHHGISFYGNVEINVKLIKRNHLSLDNFVYIFYEYSMDNEIYNGYEMVNKEFWNFLQENKCYCIETDIIIEIDDDTTISKCVNFSDLKIIKIYKSKKNISFYNHKYSDISGEIQWFKDAKILRDRENVNDLKSNIKQSSILDHFKLNNMAHV